MKTVKEFEYISYIETPRRSSDLVKIDVILQARMRAFLEARSSRRFTFFK